MLKDREDTSHVRGGRPRGAKEHTQDHTAVTAESSPRSAWSQTPCSLCLPERHRTSSAHEFSALRQPLVLLISSSSHYQEVADVSYRATSGVTAFQARGTAHLVSGLPGADSASPRACRFARRAPSCVSFSLHVPHYRWTTPRASSKKPNLGKKKKQVLMLPCLLDFSPSPPALYLSPSSQCFSSFCWTYCYTRGTVIALAFQGLREALHSFPRNAQASVV